jgi:hypothetical protein
MTASQLAVLLAGGDASDECLREAWQSCSTERYRGRSLREIFATAIRRRRFVRRIERRAKAKPADA